MNVSFLAMGLRVVGRWLPDNNLDGDDLILRKITDTICKGGGVI